MIYHVVAVSKNGVIGKDGKLPWHFSADMKFFKALTTGHTVIMGRKTFDSIGKPLPNRQNLVLSKKGPAHPSPSGAAAEVSYCASWEAALQHARSKNVFIIGGSEIYKQTLDKIDGIYLTRIDQEYEGDAFYPGVPDGFKELSRTPLQENPLIEVVYYQRAK